MAAAGGNDRPPFEIVPITHLHPFSEEALVDNSIHNHIRIRSNITGPLQARFGHSAVYLASRKQLLFIGGQIGTQGTYVTNDVLSLNLTQDYALNESESLGNNPSVLPNLSDNLPPNAWTASTIDSNEIIWLIGGVTEDCQSDASAHILNIKAGTAWEAVEPAIHRPPRRRQASALVMTEDKNGRKGDTLYVFGGIAEPYTCSIETVGYLAMDAWDASMTSPAVQTLAWTAQPESKENASGHGTNRAFVSPPISDYAAVRLQNTDAIIYLGGQDAYGNLLSMGSLLLFNTSTHDWSIRVHMSHFLPFYAF